MPDAIKPETSKARRVTRIYLQILALLLVSLPLSAFLVVNYFTDQVLYFKYGKARWAQQRPGLCSPARRQLVYADLQPGHNAQRPLELSCEAARQLPGHSDYALTRDGLKIHYRLFETASEQAPLLLHVPGITSSWLDGARYAPLAKRLGFRLAVLELRNHGISGNNGQGAAYGCLERQDVLAVVRSLQQRYPQRPMLIWGASMGSMSVLNAAAELRSIAAVKALVLENLPTSMREVLEESFSPGKPGLLYEAVVSWASVRNQVDYRRCAPLALGPALRIPAFVSVSSSDTLTPPAMVRRFYDSLPAGQGHRFKLYPYGQHAAIWNGQPKAYEADILAFWRANFS